MTQTIFLFVGIIVATVAYILKLRLEISSLKSYIATLPEPSEKPLQTIDTSLTPIPVHGAGNALKSPPTTLQATLDYIKRQPNNAFMFPLGWYAHADHVGLATAKFKGDVNHILLTGQSDSGKDNAALNIMLSLALLNNAKAVQFCIIDGKGLDWMGWQNKSHTWHIAMKPEDVKEAMERLTNERIQRYDRLASAKVKKWDSYIGNDMPLLVVFVSELLLLQNAVGKSNLTSWLNAELTSARAAGIRYIIATQTASQFDTQWRSQVSLMLAGYQPLDSQDKPNTGMSASEITTLDAVAPSKLPNPASGASGVFLALQGANAINVRTSYITDTHADFCLSQLPNSYKNSLHNLVQTGPKNDADVLANLLNDDYILVDDWGGELKPVLQNDVERNRATEIDKSTVLQNSSTNRTDAISPSSDKQQEFYVELPFSDDKVPFVEQQRIIEHASTVNSKRQLCLKLYGTDGGQKSTWVKLVCDALGLLQQPSVGVGK